MNIPELEDDLVELLAKSINKKKVAEALTSFMEHEEKLNGPEVVEYAATCLAAIVKTCPSREIAFKLFFKCLTQSLPGVGVNIVSTHGMDEGAS